MTSVAGGRSSGPPKSAHARPSGGSSSIPFHLIRERPSMTTSRAMPLKSAVSREDIQLTPAQLGYFNARAQSKAPATVPHLFSRLADDEGLTRAFLAPRHRKHTR